MDPLNIADYFSPRFYYICRNISKTILTKKPSSKLPNAFNKAFSSANSTRT